VPQANSQFASRPVERKKFIGVELQGKTLGSWVWAVSGARRQPARMHLAWRSSPLIPSSLLTRPVILGSRWPFDEVLARADFLTVHTPLTTENSRPWSQGSFRQDEERSRVINCARGGLIDEDALYEAIKSGIVAGAALMFSSRNPAFGSSAAWACKVIATPALGASTTEAQEGVRFHSCEQMRDYLLTGATPRRRECPCAGSQVVTNTQPFLELPKVCTFSRPILFYFYGNIEDI